MISVHDHIHACLISLVPFDDHVPEHLSAQIYNKASYRLSGRCVIEDLRKTDNSILIPAPEYTTSPEDFPALRRLGLLIPLFFHKIMVTVIMIETVSSTACIAHQIIMSIKIHQGDTVDGFLLPCNSLQHGIQLSLIRERKFDSLIFQTAPEQFLQLLILKDGPAVVHDGLHHKIHYPAGILKRRLMGHLIVFLHGTLICIVGDQTNDRKREDRKGQHGQKDLLLYRMSFPPHFLSQKSLFLHPLRLPLCRPIEVKFPFSVSLRLICTDAYRHCNTAAVCPPHNPAASDRGSSCRPAPASIFVRHHPFFV